MREKLMESKDAGITLIALVVTIIVLLILAGVSISMLTGQNGILKRAAEAKEKTEQAQKEENEALSNYESTISQYAGIDWNTIKKNAEKNPDQKNSDTIAIGTDGKSVNMDLWQYTKLDDGTYGLNDAESLTDNGTKTTGYIGKIVNGKIEGSVPKYIKGENDEDFCKVTNMAYTFFNNKDLEEAPEIPDEVTNIRALFNSCENLNKIYNLSQNAINMYGTFANCKNLKQVPKLPNSVENMRGTFFGCIGITEPPIIPGNVKNMSNTFSGCANMSVCPNIPNGVTDMSNTFYGCANMKVCPNIPNGVTNMSSTFYGCSSITEGPAIPNTVENMYATFYECTSLIKAPTIPESVNLLCVTFKGCTKLQGEIEINANVTGKNLGKEWFDNIDYNNCFLNACTDDGLKLKVTGKCTVIDKIVENANNPNITLK